MLGRILVVGCWLVIYGFAGVGACRNGITHDGMEPIEATLDRRQLIDHLPAGQVIFGIGAAAVAAASSRAAVEAAYAACRASATAVRDVTSSLRRMFETCTAAVFGEM